MVAPHQLRALQLIDDCNLYHHIFTLSPRDPDNDPTSTKKKSPHIEAYIDPPRAPAESVAAGQLVVYLLQHRIAEFLQLDFIEPTKRQLSTLQIPWLMAGLAPWRDIQHPNPPKKEPKFLASLITKHELMYGEEKRDVVEDTFEKGKLKIIRNGVEKMEELSRLDAGISFLMFY
jgi:tRNA nucleotidyltransferase/poly(A) polymerase